MGIVRERVVVFVGSGSQDNRSQREHRKNLRAGASPMVNLSSYL